MAVTKVLKKLLKIFQKTRISSAGRSSILDKVITDVYISLNKTNINSNTTFTKKEIEKIGGKIFYKFAELDYNFDPFTHSERFSLPNLFEDLHLTSLIDKNNQEKTSEIIKRILLGLLKLDHYDATQFNKEITEAYDSLMRHDYERVDQISAMERKIRSK